MCIVPTNKSATFELRPVSTFGYGPTSATESTSRRISLREQVAARHRFGRLFRGQRSLTGFDFDNLIERVAVRAVESRRHATRHKCPQQSHCQTSVEFVPRLENPEGPTPFRGLSLFWPWTADRPLEIGLFCQGQWPYRTGFLDFQA